MTPDQEKALRAELEETKRWRAVAAHIAATDIASLRTALAAAQGVIDAASAYRKAYVGSGPADHQKVQLAKKALIYAARRASTLAALSTSGKLGPDGPHERCDDAPCLTAAEFATVASKIEDALGDLIAFLRHDGGASLRGKDWRAIITEAVAEEKRLQPIIDALKGSPITIDVPGTCGPQAAPTSGKPGGEVVLGARRALEPEEVVPAYSAAEAGKPGGPPCTSLPATSASKDRLDVSLSAWPIPDVLERLADAADHLRGDHNCDAEGHEGVLYAAQAARAHAKALRTPAAEVGAEARGAFEDGAKAMREAVAAFFERPPIISDGLTKFVSDIGRSTAATIRYLPLPVAPAAPEALDGKPETAPKEPR